MNIKFYFNYSAGYPAKKLAGYPANSVSGATLTEMGAMGRAWIVPVLAGEDLLGEVLLLPAHVRVLRSVVP